MSILWTEERAAIIRNQVKKDIRKKYRLEGQKCPANYEELHKAEIDELTAAGMQDWLFKKNMAINKGRGKALWEESEQEGVELFNDKEKESMGFQKGTFTVQKVEDLKMPEPVAEVIKLQVENTEVVEIAAAPTEPKEPAIDKRALALEKARAAKAAKKAALEKQLAELQGAVEEFAKEEEAKIIEEVAEEEEDRIIG